MADVLVDDLRAQIAAKQVLVVVGAGVSVGASGGAPVASWTGLLHDGVTRAETVGQGRLPPNWGSLVRQQIDSGDLDFLLSAAESITAKLGGRSGGEYRRWLRESVGALELKDRSVIEALIGLGAPVATTNYDGLVAAASGWPVVTWRAGARVQRVLRGDEQAVLHLHGHWEDPESVVLGIRSYESVLGDASAQALQQAMASLRSLLFVGFGAGLHDPNFGALRAWLGATFPGAEYRHFRLCLDGEVATVAATHDPGERFMVVGVGPERSDLAPFLRGLAPPSHATAAEVDARKKAPVGGSVGLPPAPVCVGRDAMVADVVAGMLASPPVPVPVLGGPGIGKSTVCLTALHDEHVADRFGERRWFVRCDGANGAAALLTGVATEIGVVSADGDLAGRLRATLGSAPAVLALDNLETPWGAEPLEVERLLAGLAAAPGVVLVCTGRGTARPGGMRWRETVPLAPLALPDAREMFLAIAGRHFVAEPALDGLLEAVDRVPLAVELLAYNAQGEPDLAGLASRWQSERVALLQRAGGRQRELSVGVSIELSLSSPQLTGDGKRLLTMMGRLPDGIAHQDLPELLPGVGLRAAANLRQVGLAFDESGRLRALAPIREHMASEHPPSEEDALRSTQFYAELVAVQGDAVGAVGGADAAVRVAGDLGNMTAALEHAAAEKMLDLLANASWGLAKYVRLTGAPPPPVLDHIATVMGAAGEPGQQADVLFSLGEIALARSDHDIARIRFEQAQPLYRQGGAVLGEANCIAGLGNIALARSDHAAARAHYEQAQLLYRQVGAVLGEANCIKGLGDIALARSDHDTARSHYEQAQLLYRQVGAVLGEANCIKGLGNIAFERSDDASARAHYERAQPLYRQVGAVIGEANCIKSLGNMALERSDHDTARAHYAQAQQLYRQVGDVRGEANCIFSVGDIALAGDNHDTAHNCYERAQLLFRQVGDVLGEANCIQGLGDIGWAHSGHDTARARYREALVLYERIQEPYSIGGAHRRLARLASGTEHRDHIAAAKAAWSRIDRQDLIDELDAEFYGD